MEKLLQFFYRNRKEAKTTPTSYAIDLALVEGLAPDMQAQLNQLVEERCRTLVTGDDYMRTPFTTLVQICASNGDRIIVYNPASPYSPTILERDDNSRYESAIYGTIGGYQVINLECSKELLVVISTQAVEQHT